MIGQRRLINIEWALRFVIANNIPGDFIPYRVWRGDGLVVVRVPSSKLSVSMIDTRGWWIHFKDYQKQELQTNFRAFGLLDNQVHLCKGYFVDSLSRWNVSVISVLRMNGDMYDFTMDQFFNLYVQVAVGGVFITDDYNIPECIRAVNDFRSWHSITEEIKGIPGDRSGSYWIRKKMVTLQMDRYKPLLDQAVKTT